LRPAYHASLWKKVLATWELVSEWSNREAARADRGGGGGVATCRGFTTNITYIGWCCVLGIHCMVIERFVGRNVVFGGGLGCNHLYKNNHANCNDDCRPS